MNMAYLTSPGASSPAWQSQDCGCEENPRYHEFCNSCCRPAHACCCGSRRCRKESKDLLLEGTAVSGREGLSKALPGTDATKAQQLLDTVRLTNAATPAANAITTVGLQTAFIGGGDCVHLSIEYMPANSLAPATGAVIVLVADSDKTAMMWAKIVDANAGYQIQEDIITTHPGATLTVAVINVIARVRWCEVFSC